MREFIIKYWVEVLFGAVLTGFGFFAKKFWSMVKNEQNQQRKDFYDEVTGLIADQKQEVNNLISAQNQLITDHKNEINQLFTDHKTEVNQIIANKEQSMIDLINQRENASTERHNRLCTEIKDLKDGLLGVYSKSFKEDCEEFLARESKEVSLEDYKELTKEHNVYNRLGGNSYGDELFEMAKEKVANEFTTK